ncbi:hypothetical protein ACJX0J_026081, partial [Zea mays]
LGSTLLHRNHIDIGHLLEFFFLCQFLYQLTHVLYNSCCQALLHDPLHLLDFHERWCQVGLSVAEIIHHVRLASLHLYPVVGGIHAHVLSSKANIFKQRHN